MTLEEQSFKISGELDELARTVADLTESVYDLGRRMDQHDEDHNELDRQIGMLEDDMPPVPDLVRQIVREELNRYIEEMSLRSSA